MRPRQIRWAPLNGTTRCSNLRFVDNIAKLKNPAVGVILIPWLKETRGLTTYYRAMIAAAVVRGRLFKEKSEHTKTF